MVQHTSVTRWAIYSKTYIAVNYVNVELNLKFDEYFCIISRVYCLNCHKCNIAAHMEGDKAFSEIIYMQHSSLRDIRNCKIIFGNVIR